MKCSKTYNDNYNLLVNKEHSISNNFLQKKLIIKRYVEELGAFAYEKVVLSGTSKHETGLVKEKKK